MYMYPTPRSCHHKEFRTQNGIGSRQAGVAMRRRAVSRKRGANQERGNRPISCLFACSCATQRVRSCPPATSGSTNERTHSQLKTIKSYVTKAVGRNVLTSRKEATKSRAWYLLHVFGPRHPHPPLGKGPFWQEDSQTSSRSRGWSAAPRLDGTALGMQEQEYHWPSNKDATAPSLKPATRLLEDVLVEIVDVKGHVDDIRGSGWLTQRERNGNGNSSDSHSQSDGQCSPAKQSNNPLLSLEDVKPAPPPPDVVVLRSPAAQRMALRAKFASIYYPRSQTPATSTFRAVIQQDADVRSNVPLAHAMDAVCLTEIGSALQNQACVNAGIQHYQCAVGMFRRGLQQAMDEQYFDSNLLATCHALMFCQRFTTLGDGDEGEHMHMKGLAHMMAARGLDSLTSEFDKLLLEDYQHYALRLGMVHRRPVHAELEKAWAKRVRSAAGPRFFPQVCGLAFHLPGLLQEADEACAKIRADHVKGNADACARAMKLMAGLGGLETTLQSWLQEWYSSMEQLPYRPVPSRSFPLLRRFLTDDLLDVFPSVLAFPSFASAVTHGRFWACLLLIRSTSAELCSAVVLLDDRPSTTQFHNVTECADDLCQSLAYLAATPDGGLAGPNAVTGHLRLAFEWYEKIRDREKMEWCKAIAALIKARGLSTPDFTS